MVAGGRWLATSKERGSEHDVMNPLCRIARNQARLAALGIHEAVQGLGGVASAKRFSPRRSINGMTAVKASLVHLSWIEFCMQEASIRHPSIRKKKKECEE